MKIGIVCPYNLNVGGAVQEIVKHEHEGLTKLGYEVRILSPQPKDTSNVTAKDVIFLGGGTEINSPMHTSLQVSASVDSDAIDHVLEQEQFDILHFHEPWVPFLSRQILSRSTSINVATFHAAIPETVMSRTIIQVVKPYTQSILKYLDEYTAVSEAAAEYIRSLTDEHINIIPNGIDLDMYPWYDRKPAKDGTKTVLFVGRLEKRKGPRYLLKAFKLLEMSDHKVRLVIAGRGPDKEKLELLAEDLGIKNVTFLGYISHEEKLELLKTADLFVAPSLYGESFGIVLLEAMASGLVTVAGNNAGYESVMDGIGQLSIVNPRDDAEFARRMSLLLNSPELQQVWLDWAGPYVRQFAYDQIWDQYDVLYKKAAKNHKK